MVLAENVIDLLPFSVFIINNNVGLKSEQGTLSLSLALQLPGIAAGSSTPLEAFIKIVYPKC